LNRPAPAFRIAFTGAFLGALGALGVVACGSDRAGFTDDTSTIDGGSTKKKDAAAPPPDDVFVPEADADADAFVWPTCDSMPATAAAKTIPQIWQANPTTASETWVAGAYVTAISGGACVANKACQIFLQADPSYASLAAAAHHGIKMFISSAVASHFTSVAVGDQVDALGWAWRYTVDAPQSELLLQVNAMLPGCTKTKSSGNALAPLTGVTLADLTLDVYENTHGPLFVQLANVSGKPDPSTTTTFGLWNTTDGGYFDAGSDAGADIVSLSPYFLPNGAFTGLTAGANTKFATITGVFGIFVPAGGPKYLELYPRTSADIVLQ
jgi:hypothetical protein